MPLGDSLKKYNEEKKIKEEKIVEENVKNQKEKDDFADKINSTFNGIISPFIKKTITTFQDAGFSATPSQYIAVTYGGRSESFFISKEKHRMQVDIAQNNTRNKIEIDVRYGEKGGVESINYLSINDISDTSLDKIVDKAFTVFNKDYLNSGK